MEAQKPGKLSDPFMLSAQHYLTDVVLGMVSANGKKQSIPSYILVYDGPVLVEESKGMVNKPNTGFGERVYITGDAHFLELLSEQKDRRNRDDWVYFLNTDGSYWTPYEGGLKNHYPDMDLEEIIKRCIPRNFSSESSSEEGASSYNAGNRAEVAALIAQKYKGVKVIILKQTGLGKLALFDEKGLVREVFLRKTSDGDIFFDEKGFLHNAELVSRYYRDAGNNPVYKNGELVPSEECVQPLYIDVAELAKTKINSVLSSTSSRRSSDRAERVAYL